MKPTLLFTLLLLAACTKDRERLLTLKTDCQHCLVKWDAGDGPQQADTWYTTERTILAEEGTTVRVELCRLPVDRYLIQGGDTLINYDTVGSFMGWLYQNGTVLGSLRGVAEKDSCVATSATVPER